MDAQLGRVLDELNQLGEHDRWAKPSNVENDVRAPLIISVPGMKAAGKRTGALVEFVDMSPTLAELAGLPLPANQALVENFSMSRILKTKEWGQRIGSGVSETEPMYSFPCPHSFVFQSR